jgi:hypothetical protein
MALKIPSPHPTPIFNLHSNRIQTNILWGVCVYENEKKSNFHKAGDASGSNRRKLSLTKIYTAINFPSITK